MGEDERSFLETDKRDKREEKRDKREGKRRKSCGTRKHRGSIEESATDSCEQAQTCLQRPKVRPMAHLNPTSLQT